MRIAADRSICIGSGMCALNLPEVFDQDARDGRVVVLDHAPVSEERRAAAREAAFNCPSGAIKVVED